jgi:hypothetical protein
VGLGPVLVHLVRTAEPVHVLTYAAAALLLGLTATVAIWSATQRVMHLQPMEVLRAE